MKINLLLLALLTVPAAPVLAQTEWVQQFPLPYLSAVACADSNHIVAVGWNPGGIVRSTNGGQTWANLPVRTKGGLRDVCFVNSSTGYAVGDGAIWITTDKGATWKEQQAGTEETLRGVCFTDEKTGTAVGYGAILRTTDGGAAWKHLSSGTLQYLHAFRFLDEKVGTVFGDNGTVLRTTDGGMTWANEASGTPVSILSVSFVGPDTGYAIDGGKNFLRTGDGGLTWHPERLALETYNESHDIHFFNSRTGLLCGYHQLLKTTDAGAVWIDQIPGLKSASVIPNNYREVTFYDINFVDSCYGFVVGAGWDDQGNMSRLVLRTTDGGVTWQRQDKSRVNAELYNVSFIDRRNGAAIGRDGGGYSYTGIYITQDSGTTWSKKFSQSGYEISDVTYIDSAAMLAVGHMYDNNGYAHALVLRSTDNGGLWHNITNDETENLLSVAVVDSTTLVACGRSGLILRSSDCGLTWSDVSGKVRGAFSDVYFADADNGVAVGDGIVYRTSDGGASWRSEPVTNSTSDGQLSFNRVCFICPDTGFAVSEDGVLLGTSDGGTSWQAVLTIPQAKLRDISFVDRMHGLAIGSGEQKDYFVETTDGGISWTTHSDRYERELYGLASAGKQKAFIVGCETILERKSSNDSCISRVSGAGTLNDVVFADREHGLAVGIGGTILTTKNEGAIWTPRTCGTTKSLNGLCFANSLTAIAVGDTGTILRTTDGGSTWNPVASGTQWNLRKVVFSDDLSGLAIGDSGTILKTTDGGDSWVSQSLPNTKSSLNDICFVGQATWVIVGGRDTLVESGDGNQYVTRWAEIRRTTDDGATWSAVTIDTLGALYGVCARGNSMVAAVGPPLTTLKSNDLGLSWAAIPIRSEDEWGYPTYYDVSFIDELNGLAVGGTWGWWHAMSYGVILRTEDGGRSWFPEGEPLYSEFNGLFSSLPLFAINWIDANTATVVGGGGRIYHAANLLTDWIRQTTLQEPPKGCRLLQNYPNPFNPTTTISYELSCNSFVSLKVYDVLGREVRTLVDEAKKMGRYEVKFDASGLASGVYFYRLVAGSYVGTMKMLVLK